MKSVVVLIAISMTLMADPAAPLRTGAETAIYEAMAASPSHVPDNEKHIHIGGGFFATFDACRGSLEAAGGQGTGSIRFSLESLGWRSRFVYLPEGPCSLRLPDGQQYLLEMHQLDYVTEPETGRLCYRLMASGDGVEVVIIADSPEPMATRPILEGTVLIRGGSGLAGGHRSSAARTRARAPPPSGRGPPARRW